MIDTWADVTEFYEWYNNNGMPVEMPTGEIFCSDDATSVCLFRKGQFQVELYLIFPQPLVQTHEHPYVEVIKVDRQAGNNFVSEVLKMGESHGAGMRLTASDKGFPLYAFQHWLRDTPSTVAAAWKGRTVGPKHETLIRRFYPNALILDGYADITKDKNYLETL